jgi:hypothetical protein
VDAQLLSAAGYPLTANHQVARFAVAQPPAIVDPAKPLYLSITAPREAFVEGTLAKFTYHVYNYGSEPITATLYYAINHGVYRPLAEDIRVPPAEGDTPGEVAIPFYRRAGTFRLRGHVAGGGYRDYASYGARSRRGSVRLSASLPAHVQRTDTVSLTMSSYPGWSQNPLTTTLHVRAEDAAGTLYQTDTLTVPVTGTRRSPTVVTRPITVPASVAAGTGYVWVEAHSLDGRIIGGDFAPLTVPASPLAFTMSQLPPLEGDSVASVPLVVANASAFLPVEQGALTLTLTTPDRSITPTAGADFTLAPSSSSALAVPLELPPLDFGVYTLTVSTADEYGKRRQEIPWPATPPIKGALDKPSYRARDTAHLALTLVNPGPFVMPLDASLNGASQAPTLVLDPYEALTYTFEVPIPAGVTAGSYPLATTLSLPCHRPHCLVEIGHIPAKLNGTAVEADAERSH